MLVLRTRAMFYVFLWTMGCNIFCKVLKCLNQCFARLRSLKSVSSKTAVDPSSRFCEFETLFQHRSRAKHWFRNLKILEFLFLLQLWGISFHTVVVFGLGKKLVNRFEIFSENEKFSWFENSIITLSNSISPFFVQVDIWWTWTIVDVWPITTHLILSM